jgi:hypothetical protein
VGDKRMTGIEALKALIEGKKIRRENWDKDEAICYSAAWNSFPETTRMNHEILIRNSTEFTPTSFKMIGRS